MLVLSRRSEESILVGRDIEIKVLGIRGDHVSLGFTAPPEVAIFRKEIVGESTGHPGDATDSPSRYPRWAGHPVRRG
jgi:carbon storage regulator CsrA